MAYKNSIRDGQVSIHKQYGPYSVEVIFKANDNPEALRRVKALIVSAYEERISGRKAS